MKNTSGIQYIQITFFSSYSSEFISIIKSEKRHYPELDSPHTKAHRSTYFRITEFETKSE